MELTPQQLEEHDYYLDHCSPDPGGRRNDAVSGCVNTIFASFGIVIGLSLLGAIGQTFGAVGLLITAAIVTLIGSLGYLMMPFYYQFAAWGQERYRIRWNARMERQCNERWEKFKADGFPEGQFPGMLVGAGDWKPDAYDEYLKVKAERELVAAGDTR